MMENLEVQSKSRAVRRSADALNEDLDELHHKLGHTRELAQWPLQQVQSLKGWWATHLTTEDQRMVPRIGGALALAFILQRWWSRRRQPRRS